MTTPYKFTWWERLLKKVGLFGATTPYHFLASVWHGAGIANAFCLLSAGWYFFTVRPVYVDWLLASIFLTSGPMAMVSASITRLPDTRTKHIVNSLGIVLCMTSAAAFVHNAMLLATSFWLMLLTFSVQSRIHESREVTWTHQEDNLALVSALLAFGAYLLHPLAPWLLPALLGALAGSHRIVLWRTLRTQKLALDQHLAVWPRMAQTKSTSDFWSAILYYVTVHNGIPPKELRRVLTHVDIEALLAYFRQESVLLYPESLVWHHQDLTAAVKERICALDDRACVVFELYHQDAYLASERIRALHNQPIAVIDSMPLPDLGGMA